MASALVVLILAAASGAVVTKLASRNLQLHRRERHAKYVQDIRQAFQYVRRNDLPEAGRLLSLHKPAHGEEDNRSFAWHYLWRSCHFRPKALTGHERDVYHVEYSPNGKTLVSCGQDGTVRVWDSATGETLLVLHGHDGDVNYVTFSPDGRTLATGGDDGPVRLWDAVSGGPLKTLGTHKDWVLCVLFTPDGQRLISSGRSGILKLWELGTGEQHSFPSEGAHIEGMALSPDGRTLVTGGWSHHVRLWNVETLREKNRIDASSRIQSVAFSHDGRSVAMGGADRFVRVCDVESGLFKATLVGHTSQIDCVTFIPDDRAVASCGSDGTVRIWDAVSFACRRVYRGGHGSQSNGGRIWCAAFSPDGETLASCGNEATLNLWDVALSQDKITIGTRGRAVRSMVFSPNVRQAIAFVLDGPEGVIVDLDLSDGKLLERRRIRTYCPIIGGALSADAKALATLNFDRMVELRHLESGYPIKSTHVPALWVGRENGVISVAEIAFSSDGRFLAISRPRGGVLLWDAENEVDANFLDSNTQMSCSCQIPIGSWSGAWGD